MKKILLMNGPNLNMLGVRDPAIYGTDTLEAIEEMVRAYGAEHGCEVDCFQSNHEGALIDRLHAAHGNYDGIVYNPGAHTHYSYALHDAVECIDVPVVEIHISDISKREEFRRHSVIAPACIAQVKGLGKEGYLRALDILLKGSNLLVRPLPRRDCPCSSNGSLGGTAHWAVPVAAQPARGQPHLAFGPLGYFADVQAASILLRKDDHDGIRRVE